MDNLVVSSHVLGWFSPQYIRPDTSWSHTVVQKLLILFRYSKVLSFLIYFAAFLKLDHQFLKSNICNGFILTYLNNGKLKFTALNDNRPVNEWNNCICKEELINKIYGLFWSIISFYKLNTYVPAVMLTHNVHFIVRHLILTSCSRKQIPHSFCNCTEDSTRFI